MPNHRKTLLGCLAIATLMAVSSLAVDAAEEVVAAPIGGRTEVIAYNPPVPGGPSRAGNCWTSSIAFPRADTWRCMIGNGIQDPCFSTSALSDGVICGANPATGATGFVLKLTKPLPAPDVHQPATPSPWIVQLAIGQGQIPGPYGLPPPNTYCSRLTGTMPFVEGLAIPFSCWQAHVESQPKLGDTQIGLLDDIKPGPVWTATEVTFVVDPTPAPNRPPFKLTGKKIIAFQKVWE